MDVFSLFRKKPEPASRQLKGDGPFAINGYVPHKRLGKMTKADEEKFLYPVSPSVIDLLPWAEYLQNERAILLDDGISVGAVYAITPAPTEGRPDSRLEEIMDIVENALQDSLPEREANQWVVQFFCQDEPDLTAYMDTLRGYVVPWAEGTEYTKAWLAEQERHLKSVSVEQGLFIDSEITGAAWRGQTRCVRMVVYRWVEQPYRDMLSPVEALNQVCDRLSSSLSVAGIKCRRQNGEQIHDWLLRWFNPDPKWVDRETLYRYARHRDDVPGELPLLNDFGESIWFTTPWSDAENGVWWFDHVAHKAVAVQKIRRPPTVGQLTGEVRRGENINAMMDLLPAGTVVSMTLVIQAQDRLEEDFARLSRNSMGENVDSLRAREDAAIARTYLGNKHKLYRAAITFFLKAPDLETLDKHYLRMSTHLLASGLEPMLPEHDVAPLSTYMRALPMNFNPDTDRRNWYTRLMFAQHFACLAPVYGRDTGTGNPGFSLFNRGGEPLSFDPLLKADRDQNAHLLMFGPTGSGKSATVTSLMAQVMAVHRPRVFLVEAGNSFGLLGDYCKAHGLSVNRVSIKPGRGISLAPFSDAHLLQLEDPANLVVEEDKLPDLNDVFDAEEDEDDEKRDVLGEMEIAARLMITGGEDREEERLTRADRGMIREAIILAEKKTFAENRQMLPEDLKDALLNIARDDSLDEQGRPKRTPQRRARAEEMAEAMHMFTEGFEGELFNRPGTPWPEVDITIVDLGTLARDGYSAQMAVSLIALFNTINNIAERDQFGERQIVVGIDEAHLITTNPLLAPYLTKIVKMWRKLGAWLWQFTQNLSDYQAISKKMLNMAEWWLCLNLPKGEIEEVGKFKTLTKEEEAMMASTRKTGNYTEGVVLSAKMKALFRVVQPSIYLALGQTEKHEKAKRRELMDKYHCSELEAAIRIARELDRTRGLRREPENV
ncbi:conjugative transfer ATPase [Citrobacter koseri]|uniref:conjugative transfer ATPase n=1 Tax=Citrobacter koseri TaxID=545 RepID=UPI0018E17BB0|nr:conjugative transfer ATPase [Citrobacter koseri]MBI0676640.1 conjugative transfer ATPase [Citrobacter koseri]